MPDVTDEELLEALSAHRLLKLKTSVDAHLQAKLDLGDIDAIFKDAGATGFGAAAGEFDMAKVKAMSLWDFLLACGRNGLAVQVVYRNENKKSPS